MANAELNTRLKTVALLIPLCLFALISGDLIWTGCMVMIAMLLALEWERMTRDLTRRYRVAGVPYIALAITSAIMLRNLPDGLYYLLFVIACVIAADSMAYFGGKRFGRHKLAPAISPGKTIEGLLCGVVCAGMIGVILSSLSGYPYDVLTGGITGIVVGLASQAGDLAESWVKRRAGVKDSGTLLPGHGGLLDRMDGYLAALPCFYVLVLLYSLLPA